jgi:TolB-like protein/Tfp pilus assembly protein PilF
MRDVIRFEDFEVHLKSGELCRRGRKIRLQNQPFQVLMLLLESPGDVVTREELRTRIWQGDIFVDFDRGLNKAIYMLRRALRDRASKPRFIESLPRRGYRFIVPIKTGEAPSTPNLGTERARAPSIESLAVLPLENLSGDATNEYFADGITAELISTLARTCSARIISRTSAMTFKSTRKSLGAIARQLRVDAIIEGTVSKYDQKVRISPELILAREDRLLWSRTFECDLCDILMVQQEIAHEIAGQIQRFVEPRQLPKPSRVHPQAYEATLKGRFFRDKMTPEGLATSIKLFTEAIELDPSYAQAYGELSQSHFFRGVFGVAHSADAFAQGRAAAEKALELDEKIVCAHNSLSAIHIFHDWDWPKAEAECRRAVELDSGDPVGYVHYADYMSVQGRHDEAIKQFRKALELDPISRVYLGHFALVLHRARRYAESIAQCRKALEIDQQYPNTLWFMALSLEQIGDLSQSVAKLERACAISKAPHFSALLGRAYAISGMRAKALDILNQLLNLSQQRYVSSFDFAVIYAGLGDLAATFRQLEEAYQGRVFRIIELTLPMFDNLRSDRRWKSLVSRIGLSYSV